jgi:isopenicillin N synthase-like dioxygenase
VIWSYIELPPFVQIVSNDKYPSVQHRVFLHKDRARQSIAAFHNVSQERRVGPAKPLLDENNLPVFREVMFADHLRAYFVTGKNTADNGKRIIDTYYIWT